MIIYSQKQYNLGVYLLFLLLFSNKIFAQISITQPFERIVFQRNTSNQANIIIAGNYYSTIDSVMARVVPLNLSWGTATIWQTISRTFTNGYFIGNLTAQGGWYQLQVNAYRNGIVIDSKTVSHVGVGEVFAIAGQSNAQGGASNGFGATDDRVNSVKFSNDYSDYNKLPIGFSQLGDNSQIAPFHYVPWAWGKLGDLLAQRLNVPILFYGAGHGGTSSDMWGNSSQHIPFNAPSWVQQPLGAPYRALENSIAFYGSITGLRGILWHQGESDPDTYFQTYYDNLALVISKSRANAEHPQLAWVIARASKNPERHINVLDGQNQLISQYPNVFPGPYTDDLDDPTFRTDGVHFDTYAGQVALANAWDANLDSWFFTHSLPMMASPLIPITLSCNGSNNSTVMLSVPSGYSQYAWSNRQNTAAEAQGISNNCCTSFTFYPPASYEALNWKLDSTQTINAAPARFAANVRKYSRKTLFSPIIDLTATTLPIFSSSASQIRPNDNITLTASNCNSNLFWSNNATLNPITLNLAATTTYTVRCNTLLCLNATSFQRTITVSTCFSSALSLSGSVTSPESSYESKQNIQSLQKIQLNGKISYNAKTKVELLPGFESKTGSTFRAYVLGCN
jgi:Carbohydrate esterase, sialic acid-specific acetylesterase